MLKKFGRKITSLALVLVLVISMFSIAVGAAEKTVDFDDELNLEFDEGTVNLIGDYKTDDTDSLGNTPPVMEKVGDNVRITANSYKTMFGGAYPVYESGVTTVRVNPLVDNILQVSFECAFSGDGSYEIRYTNGDVIYPIGSRYYIGDEFDIVLTTAQAENKSVELVLSNIQVAEDDGTQFSFSVPAAQGGTVTVNNETAPYDYEAYRSENLKLSATPDDGYVFAGYYLNDSETAFTINSDFILWPYQDMEITPVFVPTDTPSFMVGGVSSGYKLCSSFSDAVQYAAAHHSDIIVPMTDFEITEDATVPSGTTLLIPNSADHEVYTVKPNVVEAKSAHSAFLKATVKSGATLTFADGAVLSIGGNLYAPGGGKQAEVTGAYGQLIVEDGAQVTLNSGSTMYAWGFVTGGGMVECMDGVTVYESFQIEDFAGGSNSLQLAPNGVFPFNQYYIQNIECKLKMNAGAQEVVLGALDAGGGVYDTSLVFIGGDGAMFNVSDGYIIKYYDQEKDKLICEVHGSASLDNIKATLPILGETDTSMFQMPINNIGVELTEGDLTIKQDLLLLPDSYVVVDEGTSVDIQSNVFLISDQDWEGQNRVFPDDNLKPLPFSATRYEETGSGASPRGKDGDMANASMEVNGAMTVTGTGTFNMTASGADFSGTGSVTNTSSVPSTTTATVKLVDFKASEKVQPEAADSECNRFKGEDYHYNEEFDRWTSRDTVTVIFMGKDPESDSTADVVVEELADVPYGTPTGVTDSTTKPYYYSGQLVYLFNGWKDSVDNKVYSSDDETIRFAFNDETTYTAQYKGCRNYYVLSFYDYDGTTRLAYNNKQLYTGDASYTGTEPTRDGYVFVGWTSSVDGQIYTEIPKTLDPADVINVDDITGLSYTAAVTYTATYRKTTDHTITWKDADGTILRTDFIANNVRPSYKGTTPTKADADGKSYKFLGWSTDGETVITTSFPRAKADATYIAVYSEKDINKHSLSLNGSIDVNFYADLPDGYDASNVTAMFKWGNEYLGPKTYGENPITKTLTGTTATVDGQEYTKFTLPLAAKELNDEISVTYRSGRNIIATETYRGTDYAYDLYQKTDDEKLKELLRTMLIYAADAQTNFRYNTDDLATYRFDELGISYDSPAVDRTKLAANAYPAENAFSDVTFYGSALNLESETGYTLYFTVNNPAGYSVSADAVSATTTDITGEDKALDLSDVKLFDSNKGLKITMRGLAAAEITNDIRLTYKGTTITVNTGEYMNLALTQGGNALQQSVTSLYNYNQAAIAYFGG